MRYSTTIETVIVPVPKPAARCRLLCFPYAGAGASMFAAWPRTIPPDVEVCAVQMPGREGRLSEPPITRWDEAVDNVNDVLMPWTDRPFAFFGHSLGAALAFEVARRFQRDRRPGLVHLFVSGRRAPHLPPDERPTYNLPDEQFLRELRRLAGTPEDVLQDTEFLELFIPLLRADFCLSETYAYRHDAPLAVPITAYGGAEDETVPPEKLEGWREHTTSSFRQVIFPGGHFFVNEARASVLSELRRELESTR